MVSYFASKLQLRHALQRQKSVFDNINIDWNISHDEGSTDFSDDETVIEDRVSTAKDKHLKLESSENYCKSNVETIHFQNGCITPEKKSRSRPPSYAGAGRESPVNIRSRSSTCDSLKSGSSPNTYRQSMAPPPPPQNRKPTIGMLSFIIKTNFLSCLILERLKERERKN